MAHTSSCRLSISTMSLGYAMAGHTLEHRLRSAQKFGYEGIELFYDDLEHLAGCLPEDPQAPPPSPIAWTPSSHPPSNDQRLRAASLIREMCDTFGLTVLCLQPFRHFEGLLDRTLHKSRLTELELWCRLAGLLRTDLILIPSNFLPADQVTSDLDAIAQDLREAADLAASANPPVRICYEALAWGTAVSKWQESYDVVKRVDRINFGLCLDTFNMAARDYAEPALSSGGDSRASLSMDQSLRALVMTVDASRIFLVQAADGALNQIAMHDGHLHSEPALPQYLSWSRNHRLFCAETEQGASLPAMKILKAIFVDLGYRGWLSHELFNKQLSEADPHIPDQMAQRGARSWRRIVWNLRLPAGKIMKAQQGLSLPTVLSNDPLPS
ncbi:3-dehydroshikimate dehydratase [Ophiostoma piceae UAMH 11346]|uniref:3-dehydroshikimate dehydratase n=1 Tax=Ophiostoma piceae (strain UAMH 11346) TaxID=1262450 RepID=S3BWA9_OPHP1|nr:3-dehydroshikimate dehydratase [Ophiostoma piceae UAMH 11346]